MAWTTGDQTDKPSMWQRASNYLGLTDRGYWVYYDEPTPPPEPVVHVRTFSAAGELLADLALGEVIE